MSSIESWISEHLEIVGFSVIGLLAFFGVFTRKSQEIKGKKLLKKAVESQTIEPISLHPEIDPHLCTGCGACVKACPEGEILKIINHKSTLVAPTKCVGHGECENACPTNAINLVFGTRTRGMEIPRISSDFETNVPGLYIAGELGGMGLIRNAVKQGVQAVQHASRTMKTFGSPVDVDILIVGAGPAGIASALAAIEARKSHLCIEQNSFGGTIYNFPRQKIVMTVPAVLPLVGVMKFKHNKVSKEELLTYWNMLRKNYGIKIKEGIKFENLAKENDIFVVKTNQGEIRARKVILSMGVRGTPRKLGLPNEDQEKVTYNLLDPEQYQNMDISVVGGGNAGVEAAQMLANPIYRNRVKLLVRGPTFDRCNEENKNIIEAMAARREVEIWYESSVKEINKNTLKVDHKGSVIEIDNDYLFVFAGAEMPFKFLMSLGINIDKKFGEVRKKAS